MGIGKWIIKTAWNKLNSSDQAGITKAIAAGRGQACPNCLGREESIKYVEVRGKNYWKNNSTGNWAYCPLRRKC